MKKLLYKTIKISGKTIGSLILIFILAVVGTSVSYVYDFAPAEPFSGPDIYNPYHGLDSVTEWKKANFHTHTRVAGPLNECEYDPAQTYDAYDKLGYDIVTFSNHNQLTTHPFDTSLQVNVYEHGYNLFKYHKLVFGADEVDYFDHLLPLFTFQKQFQIDHLAGNADFLQLNHPLRTNFFSKNQLSQLEGFRIMELDSGCSTENEYWDWSLSGGHYSFGLANDDLHFPDRSNKIGVRGNFLSTPSGRYEDLKEVLLRGAYYSMRIPDYGKGDWETKYSMHKDLPRISGIGLTPGDTVYIKISTRADSIKFIGQDHSILAIARDTTYASYHMTPTDPYARIIAYLPGGEVIYSNPFARYDASLSDTPYKEPMHTVNIPLTIFFNLLLLLLFAGSAYLLYRLIKL